MMKPNNKISLYSCSFIVINDYPSIQIQVFCSWSITCCQVVFSPLISCNVALTSLFSCSCWSLIISHKLMVLWCYVPWIKLIMESSSLIMRTYVCTLYCMSNILVKLDFIFHPFVLNILFSYNECPLSSVFNLLCFFLLR